MEQAATDPGITLIGGIIAAGFIYFVIKGLKKSGRAKKRLEEGKAKIDELRGK